MPKSKSARVEKNNEFILVTSNLVRGLIARDPDQELIYLPVDISWSELGKMIRKKLNESRYIDDGMAFHAILGSEKWRSLEKNTESEQKKLFGYKTKRALYQYMNSLSIEIYNDELIIEPEHRYALTSLTSVKGEDGKAIKFKYPVDLSDEALGKAAMEAFEYCTSVYMLKPI